MNKELDREQTENYLTVSQITGIIKRTLESVPTLKNIWIVGEVSGYKKQALSGHVYFNLKDEKTQIPVVLFSMYAKSVKFKIIDGNKIKVFGSLNVYEKGGRYTFRAVSVLPFGEGELFARFQILKKKLEKEGLFAESRKKPLPLFPRRIALITSKSGSTLHDMLRTIRKKNKIVDVLIIPARVQGDEIAAQSIKNAIELANSWQEKIDLIILARGGGSLEDLWVFNTETVARAIYASEIPIVTGIGHDTDYTIADFVSDLRTSTPTAAADKAVPALEIFRRKLEDMNFKLAHFLEKKLERYRKVLDSFQRISQVLKYQLSEKGFEVGALLEKIYQLITSILKEKEFLLTKTSDYLNKLPELKLKSLLKQRESLSQLSIQLEKNMSSYFNLKKRDLKEWEKKLELLSVNNTLKRGFAIVWDKEKKAIKRSVQELKKDEEIVLHLKDGFLKSKVLEGGER
jgi:exodeoxyribonuclease VII large subunit